MSIVKNVLKYLFVITALFIAGIYIYTSFHTFSNDENVTGFTAGNLYNGGLFSERDGIIYFSNDKDSGSLYIMNSDTTNIKKLSNDKAVFINVDENYIYYVKAVDTENHNTKSMLPFNNTGIYRVNQNGKKLTLISNYPGSYLTQAGNYVYYQKYEVEKGLNLYRNKTDGSSERLLLKEAAVPITVLDNRLYYTGEYDNNIYYLDLSSFTTGIYIEGNFVNPVFFGDYIYYIDQSDKTINRINKDGSDRVVLVDEPCSAFNLTKSGQYLYYQVDDNDNSKLCRINLEISKTDILQEGHFKQINVTSKYVFFKDLDNSNTYMVAADGKPKVEIFDPLNTETDNKKPAKSK